MRMEEILIGVIVPGIKIEGVRAQDLSFSIIVLFFIDEGFRFRKLDLHCKTRLSRTNNAA